MRVQAACVAFLFGGVLLSAAAGPAEPGSPVEVRIGLPQSMFRDASPEAAVAAVESLVNLLQTRTGIQAKCSLAPDSETLARDLAEGKLHLGIMQGVEYAWLKDRYPRLKPALLACNEQAALRAFLVGGSDNDVQSIKDLRHRPFAMPKCSLNHCYYFLDAAVRRAGHNPKDYFTPASRPANSEDALDAVVDGQTPATVVDGVALETYRERKPGRARRLRVIEESCAYPAPAFIARIDGSDAETIKSFQDGMAQVHRHVLGRQVLTFWRLSRFEPVSDEYAKLLAGVLKVHPEPITPSSFAASAEEATGPR